MIVLLLFSVVCAALGAWLIFDFCLWFWTGHVVAGTIEAFEKGKPVITFEAIDGRKLKQRAERIMHMGYMVSAPQPGEVFNVIYKDEPPGVRVYGYLYLVAGAVLFMPGLAYLAMQFGRQWMAGQVSFLLVFAVILIGGWILMKFVRRNY